MQLNWHDFFLATDFLLIFLSLLCRFSCCSSSRSLTGLYRRFFDFTWRRTTKFSTPSFPSWLFLMPITRPNLYILSIELAISNSHIATIIKHFLFYFLILQIYLWANWNLLCIYLPVPNCFSYFISFKFWTLTC